MRYQTIDTTTGEVLAEYNRHPLSHQLQRRVSASKRQQSKRRLAMHLDSETALIATVCGVVIGLMAALNV